MDCFQVFVVCCVEGVVDFVGVLVDVLESYVLVGWCVVVGEEVVDGCVQGVGIVVYVLGYVGVIVQYQVVVDVQFWQYFGLVFGDGLFDYGEVEDVCLDYFYYIFDGQGSVQFFDLDWCYVVLCQVLVDQFDGVFGGVVGWQWDGLFG